MNINVRYYEALEVQLQKVNYEFTLIIDIMRNSDSPSCKFWNNFNQMNDLYYDTAKSLRISSVNLIETIQGGNNKTDMHVNTVKVNVPGQGADTIYRILKREAVALHFVIEEFVSRSAPILQSKDSGNSLPELETLFSKGMKHFSYAQGASNCLQKELDKNGISYNVEQLN